MIDTRQAEKHGFIPKTISRDQAKDTGMAMVFICLLINLLGKQPSFGGIACGVLLLNMIWPGAFKPVAKLWLGLSHLLGTVMSKVILTIIFYGMVLPIGLLRRICGADSLQLKKWKQDNGSVFKTRNHRFTAEDINQPY